MLTSYYIKSRRFIMIFDSEVQKKMILEVVEAHPKLGIQGDLTSATQYIANLQALKKAVAEGAIISPKDQTLKVVPTEKEAND